MAKQYEVIVATHGDKQTGGNPGMTTEGFLQLRSLKPRLPHGNIYSVVCGTGRRHYDVARALNFFLTTTRWDERAGVPASLENVDGAKMIVLADGTMAPFNSYTGIGEKEKEAEDFILSLKDATTLVCAGRPLMNALLRSRSEQGKSAAIYKIVHNGERINFIVEIAAYGDAGHGSAER